MPGTIAGGVAAAKTNKQRHGPDFYKIIGAKGGKLGKRHLTTVEAQAMGKLGGLARWQNVTPEQIAKQIELMNVARKKRWPATT